MPLFPVGDNDPIDIYAIKSPLDGTELFEIINEGTTKLYGRISDLMATTNVTSSMSWLDTTASVASSILSVTTMTLVTAGWAAIGDGGGAVFKRVSSMPSHPGRIQSFDGTWWEMFGSESNVRCFGADPTATNDCAPQFRNAILYASAVTPARPFYIPEGKYNIGTTVVFPTEFVIRGDGPVTSQLIPKMVDGTACLKYASGNQHTTLKNFGILTTLDWAGYLAGSAAQNCIGLDGMDVSVGHTTRYLIDNVVIYGCKIGFQVYGWDADIRLLKTIGCDLGFWGIMVNNSRIQLLSEVCLKHFNITDTWAVHLDTCMGEDADKPGLLSSTLDNNQGVVITAPYFETGPVTPRQTPYLRIGSVSKCQSVRLLGGIAENIRLSRSVAPIAFDNCDGGYCDVYLPGGTTSLGLGVSIGSASRRVHVTQSNNSDATHAAYVYEDFSTIDSPPVNYFPNSFFDVWFKGWDQVNLNHLTMSQHLNYTRRGRNNVRIQATAGTSNNYIEFILPSVTAASSAEFDKTFRVGAWLFINGITEYEDGTLNKLPDVSILWKNASAVWTESPSVHPAMIATNTWIYVYGEIAVGSDVASLAVRVYANRTANNATGNEAVLIDSITVMDVVTDFDIQKSGAFVNNPYMPTFEAGGQLRQIVASAPPTDVNQTYSRADQALLYYPTDYMSPGWQCVTGGAGGTAVWAEIPGPVFRGTVVNLPARAGTYAGMRAFATNARNGVEGAGAGTGCYCTLNSAGAWLADWSGLAVTA
jgi:hypothetical protein